MLAMKNLHGSDGSSRESRKGTWVDVAIGTRRHSDRRHMIIADESDDFDPRVSIHSFESRRIFQRETKFST
jgi:hypothetical protein